MAIEILVSLDDQLLSRKVLDYCAEHSILCQSVSDFSAEIKKSQFVITDEKNMLNLPLKAKGLLIHNSSFEEAMNLCISSKQALTILFQKDTAFQNNLKSYIKNISSEDHSNIAHHLESNTPIFHLELETSLESQNYIETIIHDLKLHDYPKLCEKVKILAYELIMNAFFDALQTQEGEQVYKNLTRNNEVYFAGDQKPILSFASDKDSIAISVTDFFGTLTQSDFHKTFDRCINSPQLKKWRPEGAGAGIGLYLSAMNSTKLIFDIDYKKRTTVTAIIKKTKRNKDFEDITTNIYFFTNEVSHEAA